MKNLKNSWQSILFITFSSIPIAFLPAAAKSLEGGSDTWMPVGMLIGLLIMIMPVAFVAALAFRYVNPSLPETKETVDRWQGAASSTLLFCGGALAVSSIYRAYTEGIFPIGLIEGGIIIYLGILSERKPKIFIVATLIALVEMVVSLISGHGMGSYLLFGLMYVASLRAALMTINRVSTT